MRGKTMANFLRKRDEKIQKKKEKDKLLKDGIDKDTYIRNAFE
jgi:hypothetical protein